MDEYQSHALNLLFYTSLCVACKILKNAHVLPNLLNSLNVTDATDALIGSCYDDVYAIYEEFGGDDRAAKGVDMRQKMISNLEKAIHGN